MGGREREDQVAARVLAGAAGARDPERAALRQARALMRQQRRIGRADHDDRARAEARGTGHAHHVRADQAPHRQPADGQALAPAVVGLDEHADREAAAVSSTTREAVPIPPLKLVADHPGAAPHTALLHGPAARARQRRVHVLGPDVEAVDVVEHAVPGLPHDRQRPLRAGAAELELGGDQRVAHDADRSACS